MSLELSDEDMKALRAQKREYERQGDESDNERLEPHVMRFCVRTMFNNLVVTNGRGFMESRKLHLPSADGQNSRCRANHTNCDYETHELSDVDHDDWCKICQDMLAKSL